LALSVLAALFVWILPVIGDTALRGRLPTMGLSAAEQTTQIAPAGIASMSGEKDTAMPTARQADGQVRLGSEDRPQEDVILQDQGGYVSPSIPAPPKLEILRDPDCKKPKLSPRVLMLNSMSSSYLIATKVSRG
jgi:hypothetical protein